MIVSHHYEDQTTFFNLLHDPMFSLVSKILESFLYQTIGFLNSHMEMKLIPIISLADLDPYYFEVISSIQSFPRFGTTLGQY